MNLISIRKEKMYRFSESHLAFALPLTFLLLWIYHPFVNEFDKFKFVVLSVIGVIFTVSWQNHVFGSISVEEYFFFVCQSIIVAVFATFITRWAQPALFLVSTSSVKGFCIRYGVIGTMTSMFYVAWMFAIPGTKLFYIGSLMCAAMPIMMYLWFVCGLYISKQIFAFSICVSVPTIGFSLLDISVTSSLQVEKMILFLITSAIIVMTSFGLDRANAILYSHYKRPLHFSDLRDLKLIFDAFQTDERKLNQRFIEDFSYCYNFTRQRSINSEFVFSLSPPGIE